ncbi:sodium bicarbonate transporter-like protein 11, partial [Eurytemora carolleeae]|uniref:sodium bicarbonate transporter-like protein 11 n=1 Tax=Eurytemora carolleeae TaxID=1294199 RepID=UPI000C75D5DE
LSRRAVGIARLKQAENLGLGHEEARYIIMVLCPTKEKETKSATETSRTFATLFADINFRTKLQSVPSENMFKDMIAGHARELVTSQTYSLENGEGEEARQKCAGKHWYHLGSGMYEDLRQRLPFYLSDFIDGFIGDKTIQKTISATIFLYFACILPAIAFGVLNAQNTDGKIGVMAAIVGQFIGGIMFSLMAGQPLVVIMTTAPLALYIKIIVAVADEHEMDFFALYTSVGLWNALYIIIYALTNATKLMKYSTRSTEEIFALFICIAFTFDALKDTIKDFNKNYFTEECAKFDSLMVSNATLDSPADIPVCHRENSILFLLLMLGTLWLATTLYNFNQTPYLQANKREILADYALPVAVVSFSFIGSVLFKEVSLDQFQAREVHEVFILPAWSNFSLKVVLSGMMLGFPLSLLFFMDQNIAESMVNSPDNKLVKEHRISNLVSNILIGVSVKLIPRPLNYIPIPVLDGLFLYLAVTAVSGNQMFERLQLLFMEQTAYPPNHYIRRVPQRKIHQFTACQVVQLLLLCVLGFWPYPYIKMIFPLMLFSFLPIRMLIIPRFIENKFLQVLDGIHQ